MSFNVTANTIRKQFKDLIATPYSLPTVYDNQQHNEANKSLWCRLNVIFGDSEQVSIGAPSSQRFRTVGIMSAQLFLPANKGDKELYEMADYIIAAFKSITYSGVCFRTPSISRVGLNGNFWQLNVNCPFYFDVIG